MNPDNMDSVMALFGALAAPLSVITFITALLALCHWFGTRMIEAFRDSGETEDKRKKKKDEYDAYYDERLAEASSDPNIAYYEDASAGAIHHE